MAMEAVAGAARDRKVGIEHPDRVHRALDHNVRGHNMAKAAIEMGCWDVAAATAPACRCRSCSAARATASRPESRSAFRRTRRRSPSARARAYEQGYRKIKVKIEPGADVDSSRPCARSSAPRVHLMADANSAYTLADADHLAELDAFDLIMLEQPLSRDDLVRHATLQQRLKTPICLDESITDVDRAEDMIALEERTDREHQAGARRRLRDVERHSRCLSSERGIPVWCGGMLESGVGRAHNVALASLPNFTLPGDLSPSARYWAQDIVTPEWTMDAEGMVHVPLDRPGIGVTVDLDRVDDLTVSRIGARRRRAAASPGDGAVRCLRHRRGTVRPRICQPSSIALRRAIHATSRARVPGARDRRASHRVARDGWESRRSARRRDGGRRARALGGIARRRSLRCAATSTRCRSTKRPGLPFASTSMPA